MRELGVPTEYVREIRYRWLSADTSLQAFAPYTYFCLRAHLMVLVLWRHKLTKNEPNNLVDVQYLYYLPFCGIFASNDSLHRKVAPFLLTKSQEFLWGPELKSRLRNSISERDAHAAQRARSGD